MYPRLPPNPIYIAKDVLEVLILLAPPPENWNYRCEPCLWGAGDRTWDFMCTSQVLYQLSYVGSPFLGEQSPILLDGAGSPTPRPFLGNETQGPSPNHVVLPKLSWFLNPAFLE